MNPALIWLIAGMVLVVAEIVSGELVLLMLGVAAIVTAGVAALDVSLVLDGVVFALISLGLLGLGRPVLKRRLQRGSGLRTNTDALIGQKAVVESRVDAHGGRVRIGGDVWSARSMDETSAHDEGKTVIVMEISGATAVVSEEM